MGTYITPILSLPNNLLRGPWGGGGYKYKGVISTFLTGVRRLTYSGDLGGFKY